jgi:Asp-tRNAAsn/Glu-tRNAGln amidotransferase A subunit and related amidases
MVGGGDGSRHSLRCDFRGRGGRGSFERMRAINPRLNAVVVDLSEEALKVAKASDKARAKGIELGPLHGVPITIKENVDYDGRPNPNGVAAQMNIVAPSDAPVVRISRRLAHRHRPDQYARILVPRLYGQSASRADAEPVGSRYHLRWIIGRRRRRGGGRHRNDRTWQRHWRFIALAGALQRGSHH